MHKKLKTHIQEFIFFAHKVGQYGLIRCGSGNLSYRIDQDIMLVTTSGAWLSELTQDNVTLCNINNGLLLEKKKPSIEIGFHRRIMQKRKDCNVVLHCQSISATTLSCSSEPFKNLAVIPEIPCYIGKHAIIDYADPGSEELATAVADVIDDHDVVVLKNHGQIFVGKNFNEALQRAVYFEFAAEILLRGGNNIELLSQEALEYLYNMREKNKRSDI